MAAKCILTCAIYAASLPHILVATFTMLFRPARLIADLERCIAIIDKVDRPAPSSLVDALLVAEDHRNHLHAGIDPVGILRAALFWIFLRKVQGASTVEQQFVRTVTGHREITLRRKLREQILAIQLCRRRSKSSICSAYLSVAYFGYQCTGAAAAMQHLSLDDRESHNEKALILVAHLKYPRPKVASPAWERRIKARARYLALRQTRIASRKPESNLVSCFIPPSGDPAGRRLMDAGDAGG